MTAAEIVRTAAAEIGVSEAPAGSNKVKYNTEYYNRAVSGAEYWWCAVFVWWVFSHANAEKLYYDGKKTASCPTLMDYYKNTGRLIKSGYKPGDIVFFNFKGGTNPVHVGIIESVSGGTVTTIEGNTSVTSNDNGGSVMRRTRTLSQIVGAGRPEYDEEEDMKRFNTIEEIEASMPYAADTIKKLISEGRINGSGKKDAQGFPIDMDLSADMIRMLVILDR